MDDNKFVITQKKFSGDSSVLSIRLPNELIEQLDKIASETNRTRSDIAQKCLEFAVDNIEIK